PKGHTWRPYVNFILETLPDHTRNIY
ncbi:DUF3440 domain-containing protein, partial [Enterococcus hirae]|nr:DUF3440 domain-containing protein [Enterococcus hirae]